MYKNKLFITCIIVAIFSLFVPVYGKEFLYNVDSINTNAPVFNLQSESAILLDSKTGTIMFEKNADEKLLPASVTKIMTLLLTMEAIDTGKLSLEDYIVCSGNASNMGGSQIYFKENEKLKVKDCLKAVAVVSANDVATALAEHIGGSVENFVSMMNNKAKELGMKNTAFKNPHGLDEEGHYTTARDISIMSRELITKHPKIKEYTSIWMDTLRDGTFALTNTNKLIRFYEGATGLKTGSTSKALFNLSATATRNDLELIAVVMKAPTSKIRQQEASQLLDYGFANYSNIALAKEGEVIKNIRVIKGVKENVDAVIKNNVDILCKKGEEKSITKNINLKEEINAPLKKGDVIGKVEYIKDKKVVKEANIICSETIEKITVLDMYKKMLKRLF